VSILFNGDYTGVDKTTLMAADFEQFTKNSDGTFKVRTMNDGRYLYFDNYKFSTHNGTYSKTGTDTAYTAVKL
jgi:hypothetical protein